MNSHAQFRSPEVWDLAEQIGDFIQYWGFKKVHGRIWAHLYVSKVPLDALEIRQRLNISKALVSLTVRDLIHYSVIREAGRSDRGTILYEANVDVREAIFNVLRSREKKMLSRISAAYQLVQQLPPRDREQMSLCETKLEKLGELVQGASSALEAFLGSDKLDTPAFHSLVTAVEAPTSIIEQK